jgi:Thiamine pyrophosphate enzyme, C-terminal TPP binding domain
VGQAPSDDLIVAFGAAIFLYHEFIDGDYLPEGAELWAVTADPDEAARAPFGHILIGDPAEAVKRLADTMPGAGRPPLSAREPLPQADTTGPAFTLEAIMDAVNAAKTDSTVIAHEWASAMLKWDRLELTRPGSLYFPASGGLGWGLPAAIGLQLGDPARRVVALLGNGAVHLLGQRTMDRRPVQHSGRLHRRAQQRIRGAEGVHPVHARAGHARPGTARHGHPRDRRLLRSPVRAREDAPRPHRAVKDALSSDKPHLIEISQRRLADS